MSDNPSVVDQNQDAFWLEQKAEAEAMRKNNYEWCSVHNCWEPKFSMIKIESTNEFVCMESYFKLKKYIF